MELKLKMYTLGIFIVICVIAVVWYIISYSKFLYKQLYNKDSSVKKSVLLKITMFLDDIMVYVGAISLICIIGCLLVIASQKYQADYEKDKMEQYKQRIEYDISNGVVSTKDIYEYNTTILEKQRGRKDKWVNIFVPDFWDELKIIDYDNISR